MNPTLAVLLAALAGTLARTLIPFLQTLRDAPDTPFDRKFLIPLAASCVISLLCVPVVLSAFPPEIAHPGNGHVVFNRGRVFCGMGTDVAREAQKLISK